MVVTYMLHYVRYMPWFNFMSEIITLLPFLNFLNQFNITCLPNCGRFAPALPVSLQETALDRYDPSFIWRTYYQQRTTLTHVDRAVWSVLGIRLCRPRAAPTPTAVQFRLYRWRTTLDNVVRFRPDTTGSLQRGQLAIVWSKSSATSFTPLALQFEFHSGPFWPCILRPVRHCRLEQGHSQSSPVRGRLSSLCDDIGWWRSCADCGSPGRMCCWRRCMDELKSATSQFVQDTRTRLIRSIYQKCPGWLSASSTARAILVSWSIVDWRCLTKSPRYVEQVIISSVSYV